jgi:3-oxoacyl-(acyl-carrier-protein) synthase
VRPHADDPSGAPREDRQRIVVTGMGLVSPYGAGVPAFLEGVREGRSAISSIEDLDVSGCRCTVGARVPRLDVTALGAAARRIPRPSQYALLASQEALDHAGLLVPGCVPERVGVFLGTCRGMTEVSEQIWSKIIESEPRFVPALLFQETVTNAVASAISIRWGFKGTNYAISSGNASGYHVLYLAANALRAGRLDAVLAGAFDVFTLANQHDMEDLGMLSATGRSLPFDARRDGFVMGEGAGVLVLERLDRARERGATVLAEIAGIGVSHDAQALDRHDPDGRGLATAVDRALRAARVAPADVEYVGAAANSTPGLDLAESRAIHAVFNGRGSAVRVGSLKGLTGEAMSASDLFNLVACIAAVRGDLSAPPTGAAVPDAACALNLSPAEAADAPFRTAVAHSYSLFGGSAAAVVVRRYEPSEGHPPEEH